MVILFFLFSLISVYSVFADDDNDQTFYINDKVVINNYNTVQVFTLSLDGMGDCTFIKNGNTEIMIDAGGTINSNKDCSATAKDIIKNSLNTIVDDGILEMVIFTHADSDHIANVDALKDWCLEDNKIGKWIDFDVKRDKSVSSKQFLPLESDSTYLVENNNSVENKDSKETFYGKYVSTRDIVLKNYIDEYYPVTKLCYEARHKYNSISDTYYKEYSNDEKISDSYSYNNLNVNFLYNYYNDHCDVNDLAEESGYKNNMSVCCMISFYDQKMLFTGDLEEKYGTTYLYGETKLIENNKDYFYDDNGEPYSILFFKAGHHGSSSSNCEAFIDVIRPQYVVIPCVASNSSAYYKHPTELAIDNFSKYTDYIYITSKLENDNITDYYGDIILTCTKDSRLCTGYNVEVNFENSNMSNSIFNDEWISSNRSYEYNIYNLVNDNSNVNNCIDGDCTYVKYGHIDGIINCGITTDEKAYINDKKAYVKRVEELCNDGILDFLIITDDYIESWSSLKELLNSDKIKEIKYCFYPSFFSNEDTELNRLKKIIDESSKIKNKICSKNINGKSLYFNMENDEISYDKIDNAYLSVSILNYDGNIIQNENKNSNAIPCLISVKSLITYKSSNFENIITYLNVGCIIDNDILMSIYNKNIDLLKNQVNFFQIPNNGITYSNTILYNDFINNIKSINNNYIKSKDKNYNATFFMLLNTSYGEVNKDSVIQQSIGNKYNSEFIFCTLYLYFSNDNSSKEKVSSLTSSEINCRILFKKESNGIELTRITINSIKKENRVYECTNCLTLSKVWNFNSNKLKADYCK